MHGFCLWHVLLNGRDPFTIIEVFIVLIEGTSQVTTTVIIIIINIDSNQNYDNLRWNTKPKTMSCKSVVKIPNNYKGKTFSFILDASQFRESQSV